MPHVRHIETRLGMRHDGQRGRSKRRTGLGLGALSRPGGKLGEPADAVKQSG